MSQSPGKIGGRSGVAHGGKSGTPSGRSGGEVYHWRGGYRGYNDSSQRSRVEYQQRFFHPLQRVTFPMRKLGLSFFLFFSFVLVASHAQQSDPAAAKHAAPKQQQPIFLDVVVTDGANKPVAD